MKTIILSSLLLLTAFTSPALAEDRSASLRDRIAEACTASDTDLVGKRLAKECRAAVRIQWQEEQRLAANGSRTESLKVAVRK